MTDAPVNRGILTDKEGAGFRGCRILVDGEQADRPFTVLDFVQKYLDPIEKKSRVCFTTRDGKISHIKPEPVAPSEAQKVIDAENAAGDARKAANDAYVKELAGAPKDPVEAATKIVQGQIIAIDQGTHTIEVKDKAGVRHPMMWAGPLNDNMARLKQWFFVSISAEKSGDLWKVIDQTYFKKPEDWPVSQQGGGGRPQRNEKPMAYESAFKSCTELVRDTDFPDLTYERRIKAVLDQAEIVGDWIVRKGGA
jgi:hypothetical protein